MARDFDLDLGLALQLADVADAISLRRFNQSTEIVVKADGSPVTSADLEIERELRARIGTERPADGILGEEFGQANQGHSGDLPTWTIDPIDHTRHFIRGNPEYATIISLIVEGRPRVGVVSAPGLGRRWHASEGSGAWSSGKRITVSHVGTLASAHLAIAGHREWIERYDWAGVSALLDTVAYPCGTAGGFLPGMLVATAQLDAFVEPWGSKWDHAATAIIVQEAGGRASTICGGVAAGGSLLVSNGALHDQLLAFFATRSNFEKVEE